MGNCYFGAVGLLNNYLFKKLDLICLSHQVEFTNDFRSPLQQSSEISHPKHKSVYGSLWGSRFLGEFATPKPPKAMDFELV